MNKLKKRILSALVAAVMCVGVLPAAAFAEEPVSEPTVVDVDATLLYSSDENQEQNQEQPATVAEGENDPAPVEGETDAQSTEVPAFPVDGTEEEKQAWYDANVERPEQTPGLDTSTGAEEDIPAQPVETPEDQNWSVFWNEETQRYELTYEIDEEAEGDQTIDLTKALDLLNQYADTASKTERDEKIAEAEQAAQEEANAEQKPEEPVSSFDQTKPEEPGKIEDLDTKLDTAYGDIISNVPRDPEGEPQESYDYAGVIAEKTGLAKDDPYVKEMASYMYDQAMVDWVMDNWDTWEADGHMYANYFGDPDTMLYYGCGITVKWPDGTNQGTPVLKDSKPVYEIDKESDTYKAYLQAKQDYEEALAAWENSEEGQAYREALGAYDTAMEAYNAKLAEIAARLENAKQAIRNEYTQRLNANIVHPGDIRKFDIYITSKSGHTYKYKDGSFTLATPDLSGNPDVDPEGLKGFDGQIIPGGDNGYLDRKEYTYSVSAALKPILNMMKDQAESEEAKGIIEREIKAGHDGFEELINYLANNSKVGDSTVVAIADALGVAYTRNEASSGYDRISYQFDDLSGAVSRYLVKYYSEKDGKAYEDLNDVFAHSGSARADMSNTENTTQSDKGFTFGGETISTTYGRDFTYNNFYQSLLSFVYGDQNDVDQMLGDITGTNSSYHPEFDHINWNSNYAELGLDYSVALEQYMSHQKAWDQANAYFNKLLETGVSVQNATAAAFTMAVNIDGELTSNNWQLTKWGWYNSLQLEQMDYDFSLTKVDENGNPITSDETGFQLWYMDVTIDDQGQELTQKMYCSRQEQVDNAGNITGYTYVFTPTESTIYTENGQLNITNTMLKDIVYYLQETEAPEGYELDNTVYVIMDEKAVANADWDALEEEAGVTLVRDENGQPVSLIQVATDANGVPYVNQEIQIVNIANPGDDPEDPDNGDPDPDPDPDPEPPTTPIEDPEVPLTETPIEEIEDPEVPLTEEPFEELEDPEVPLAEVPMTGDSPLVMMIATFAALTSAAWLFLLRKREHNA